MWPALLAALLVACSPLANQVQDESGKMSKTIARDNKLSSTKPAEVQAVSREQSITAYSSAMPEIEVRDSGKVDSVHLGVGNE